MKNQKQTNYNKRLREIKSINGYLSGESLRKAAHKSKTTLSNISKLNSNENLFVPKEKLISFLINCLERIDPRMYPQEEEAETKVALGKYLKISPTSILLSNGSDPLLSFITQLFSEKGDSILSIYPTFGMYRVLANLRGTKYLEISLNDDFSLDVQGILDAATSNTKILFLCSPNNPTANQFNIQDVRALIEEFQGLLIVDEAYAEFADYSIIPLINEYDNLVVIRTFSKAFGLAGLRFGYAICNPDFTVTLSEKAQLPFPVSTLILELVKTLLDNKEIFDEALHNLKRERSKLIDRLNNITGIKAFDSKTNFILFKTVKNPDEIYQSLLDRGFLIRKIGEILNIKSYLRMTIAPSSINNRLLSALEEIMSE
jgi:histidinol-phosphate aminotransferase